MKEKDICKVNFMLMVSLLFGFCKAFSIKNINTTKKSRFYLCFMINVLESDSQVSKINTKNATYLFLTLLISIDVRFRPLSFHIRKPTFIIFSDKKKLAVLIY